MTAIYEVSVAVMGVSVGPVRATSFYILLARRATSFNNGIIHHCFR